MNMGWFFGIVVLLDDVDDGAEFLEFLFGTVVFEFLEFFLVNVLVFVAENLPSFPLSHVFEQVPHGLRVVKQPNSLLDSLVRIILLYLQFVIYYVFLLKLIVLKIVVRQVNFELDVREFLLVFQFQLYQNKSALSLYFSLFIHLQLRWKSCLHFSNRQLVPYLWILLFTVH